MTNLQEDLTLALQRRAEAVTVENHLDAILDDHNIIRFSNNNSRGPATKPGAPRRSKRRRNRWRRRADLGNQRPHPTARGVLDGPGARRHQPGNTGGVNSQRRRDHSR